jgi:hypothetical protein
MVPGSSDPLEHVMQIRDARGLAVSGASAASVADFDLSMQSLECFAGDPLAPLEAAILRDPGFVMAHAAKAWLYLVGTEPSGLAPARAAWEAAHGLPADDRERGHLAAIGHLVQGRWHDAGRTLEDVSIAYPRDALALQMGQLIDYFTGDARMLRDRIARALPAWDAGMPDYHMILGMHAFGLEESGDYVAAEVAGRRGVELQPRNAWAQHAVAHVLEMQGRQADGIRWMTADPDAWAVDNAFAVHNWWHLALYHLDLGDIDAVLRLYDGPIYGARSQVALDMIDASALLWRLHLRGVEVGDRWQAVADAWAPHATAGNYAFNDVHAMMAFIGAGRGDLADTLMATQVEAIRGTGDNAAFTRDVGAPVTRALRAFAEGDARTAVRLLRRVRPIAHRFGGSHAQRDIIDLTLIEAAFRAREIPLAMALSAERAAAKPSSPLARAFVDRSEGLRAAA